MSEIELCCDGGSSTPGLRMRDASAVGDGGGNCSTTFWASKVASDDRRESSPVAEAGPR
jgi:hypothetical protein